MKKNQIFSPEKHNKVKEKILFLFHCSTKPMEEKEKKFLRISN
jgi:hypothetical protein